MRPSNSPPSNKSDENLKNIVPWQQTGVSRNFTLGTRLGTGLGGLIGLMGLMTLIRLITD